MSYNATILLLILLTKYCNTSSWSFSCTYLQEAKSPLSDISMSPDAVHLRSFGIGRPTTSTSANDKSGGIIKLNYCNKCACRILFKIGMIIIWYRGNCNKTKLICINGFTDSCTATERNGTRVNPPRSDSKDMERFLAITVMLPSFCFVNNLENSNIVIVTITYYCHILLPRIIWI